MSGVSFNHRTIKIAEWERNKKQVIALPTFRNFFLIKSGERNQKRERQREKVWWRISKGPITICITFVSYFIGNLEKKVPTFRISSEIQKTIEISCFIKFLFIINIFYDIKNLFFFFSLNWFFSIPFKISPKDFPLFSFEKEKRWKLFFLGGWFGLQFHYAKKCPQCLVPRKPRCNPFVFRYFL